jgi:CRISPR/Cas system-associated exonuclease Cas4 (RecB family)
MDRSAWLAERKKGVGGSDVASLFNEGYGCTRRLWYDKVGIPEDYPREETKAMALGNVLEPFFAGEYTAETGRELFKLGESIKHPELSELRVNIDYGIIEMGPRYGVLEIKSVSRGVFYNYKRSGLPEDYILQLQHGMLATGWTWGAFCIGNRDSGEIMHWDVARSTDICNRILEEVPRFWELVERAQYAFTQFPDDSGDLGGRDKLDCFLAEMDDEETAPPRLEPDDRRCQSCQWRLTCQGNALIVDAPAEYDPDESLASLVQEYVSRAALKKEAEELLDETKEELKHRLGERGKVAAAGAKIQYYTIHKKEYTVKAHDERALRVYPAKEKA